MSLAYGQSNISVTCYTSIDRIACKSLPLLLVRLEVSGGVAERSKAAVLKTVVGQLTVGSNPTPSASCWRDGRAAEGTSLLRKRRGNSTVGSNPTLSATSLEGGVRKRKNPEKLKMQTIANGVSPSAVANPRHPE